MFCSLHCCLQCMKCIAANFPSPVKIVQEEEKKNEEVIDEPPPAE